MSALRRPLLGLGLLGALLIGIGIALSLASEHSDHRALNAAVNATLMATYIYVGLWAWWRRPHNRVGMLMTAAGFAAFFEMLVASNASLPFSLGVTFDSLYLIVAVHMLLAFPTGHVPTRAQRRILAGGYALTTIGTLLFSMFSARCGCRGPHPANVFLVTDAPGVATAIDTTLSIVGVGLIGAVAVVLVKRWRTAGARERTAYAPVLWTGAAMVALLAVLLFLDVAYDDGMTIAVASWAAVAALAALPFAFITGLVRSRAWRAGAVTELVEALGDAPVRGRLRDALAEALGDPTLELAYWLDETGQYVDERGRPLMLPAGGDAARAATEVEREGRRVGALVHDVALCDEPDLIRAVGVAAALALDNERLDAELRARVDDLRRSRQRLIDAAMSERRRLERDLHDGAQQRLVSLSLQLGLISQQLDRDPRAARELLAGARGEARAALEDLRELARGIHPAVLTDRGLGPALEALADRSPLPVRVDAVPADRLPAAVEAAVYFLVAESLTNVAKYAHATRAQVAVLREHDRVLVTVRDDGVGGADPARGSGLRGLADRLAALDGRLELESEPGRGTQVRARIPCSPVEVTV